MGYSVVADLYGESRDHVMLMLVGLYPLLEHADVSNFFAEKWTEQLDATVLIFDYSGHGDSPFEIGENATSTAIARSNSCL